MCRVSEICIYVNKKNSVKTVNYQKNKEYTKNNKRVKITY